MQEFKEFNEIGGQPVVYNSSNEQTPIGTGRPEQKVRQKTPDDPLGELAGALRNAFPLGVGTGSLIARVQKALPDLSPNSQKALKGLLQEEPGILFILWGTDPNSPLNRTFQAMENIRKKLREMGISPQAVGDLAEELLKIATKKSK